MRKTGRALVFVSCLLIQHVLLGQTFSPYSALGLGDLYTKALVQHYSMGGFGLSSGSNTYANTLNPALLSDNAIYSFTAGMIADRKEITQGENREFASGGTLSYLNMVLPLNPGNVSVSVGLFPYSRVNYNFEIDVPVNGAPPGTEATSVVEGSGGFTIFDLSAGFKVSERVKLGGRVAYMFGSINSKSSVFLMNPLGPYVPVTDTRLTAHDFIYGLGAEYSHPLSKTLSLSIGATYDFQKKLGVTKFQQLLTNSSANTTLRVDTLIDNIEGSILLPQVIAGGISLERMNNWRVGIDVRFQPWSEYVDFQGINGGLVDASSVGLGGEIIPSISEVKNYFARIRYSLGVNYGQTYYQVQNTQIDEIGINIGFSLPVANFSSLDLGFRYGSRGELGNNLIKENFSRFYFGFSFNDRRWFQRAKFN